MDITCVRICPPPESSSSIVTSTASGKTLCYNLPVAQTLLEDPSAYAAMARGSNPYGDGKASRRILEFLRSALEGGSGGGWA